MLYTNPILFYTIYNLNTTSKTTKMITEISGQSRKKCIFLLDKQILPIITYLHFKKYILMKHIYGI